MISVKTTLPLLVVVICFSTIIPIARADTFGFYATGTFQFDSNTLSGAAEGLCEGQCVPWGEVVILDVSFSASVSNYEQAVSCANNQCETQMIGSFSHGIATADLAVYGSSPQTYYLSSNSLEGSFSSRVCTGHCGSNRPQTELSLDFDGLWSNNWYSTSIIQMECFHESGCSDGSGAGSLTTATPEPSVVTLLLAGISSLCVARRRNYFKTMVSLRTNCYRVLE